MEIQENIINELLDSPMAPAIVERVQSVLEDERKRRELFYNQITEQEKAEFINGEVIVHSPVRKIHSQIGLNLIRILDTYIVEHELGFLGFEKILIRCTRNDYEPDLCFFEQSIAAELEDDRTIFPIPNFIVEVLSKGTAARDRGIKFDDYEAHGVQEYWIIDPDEKMVEQYLLSEEGKFELRLKSNSGKVQLVTIEGLVVPIEAIFDAQLAHQFIKELYLNS
ncbi:MAG: Uma2 family endonuclease [Bacteroidota bacterium]